MVGYVVVESIEQRSVQSVRVVSSYYVLYLDRSATMHGAKYIWT